MKMKNNDNDVYFLGNKQQNHLRKYAVAITFAVICALGIVYIFSIKSDVTYKQGLPTIETLPPKRHITPSSRDDMISQSS